MLSSLLNIISYARVHMSASVRYFSKYRSHLKYSYYNIFNYYFQLFFVYFYGNCKNIDFFIYLL